MRTINEIELASELAHRELTIKFKNEREYGNPSSLYTEDSYGTTYTDEAQEVFNELYDEFFDLIESNKVLTK
mgnify:CR=1 FL=1